MMAKKKKKIRNKSEDLSIINEVKEPFSWNVFWDEQIVGRWKALRTFLEEKGILFFLMSPFQYRNRLITTLVVIFVGVMVGVVPRTMQLLEQTKERNAQTELASIMDKTFTSGILRISPMASSYRDRQHVLIFGINGETSDGVPSTAEGYDVRLTPARGVVDAENVNYRYGIVPINASTRLLLVYVDNTQQNDKTGVFNLSVSVKGTELMEYPMEVVLSDGQDESDLFVDGKVDLSMLSSTMENASRDGAIAEARESLESAITKYELNEERLIASGMSTNVTTDDIREYVDHHLVMTGLSDDTTTREAVDLPYESMASMAAIDLKITVDGVEYDAEMLSGSSDSAIDVSHKKATEEYQILTNAVKDVTNAISALNNARSYKYQSLISLSTILNDEIYLGDLVDAGSVKE